MAGLATCRLPTVPVLVHIERLAVRIEAGAGKLRLADQRLREIVDLAVKRQTADVLRQDRTVLAEEHVSGLRHDDDVVRMFEEVRRCRLVDERQRFTAGVILPDLPQVLRTALGAVEVDSRATDPHAFLSVEHRRALVLCLETHRREPGNAIAAIIGVIVVIRLVDRDPFHRIRHPDRTSGIHVRAKLVLQLQCLQRTRGFREVAGSANLAIGHVAIEARATLRPDIAVFRLVKDTALPDSGFVVETPRRDDGHRRDRDVRRRINLEDVAVLECRWTAWRGAERWTLDDFLARDPLLVAAVLRLRSSWMSPPES